MTGDRYNDDDDGWRKARDRQAAEAAAELVGAFRLLTPIEVRQAVTQWAKHWQPAWTRKPARRFGLAATTPDPLWEGARLSHVADLVHSLETLQPGSSKHPADRDRVLNHLRGTIEMGETDPEALWRRAVAFYTRGRAGEATNGADLVTQVSL